MNTVLGTNLELKRTPSQTVFSRLCFCLPYFIGEVASARSWRMTEGSVFANGDPSVLILEKAEARSTCLNEAGEA
jgi:hypothetical protein